MIFHIFVTLRNINGADNMVMFQCLLLEWMDKYMY